MKYQWSIRKGSAFPILGFVFALLALAFSMIIVRLTGYLDFRLPYFLFNTGKQISSFIGTIVPAISAVVLLITCLCHCFGFGKVGVLVSVGMLFLSTVCRMGVDLYIALYVDGVAFYPFSLAYLDVLLALVLLVIVFLTYFRALRTGIPASVAGFVFGIAICVLTVLRVGGYGSANLINFSGMLFYLCSCVALSLCFMAWSGEAVTISASQPSTAIPSIPVSQPAPAPAAPVAPEMSAKPAQSEPVIPACPPQTEDSVEPTQPETASAPVPPPAEGAQPAQPVTPPAEAVQPAQPVTPPQPTWNGMPIPMEGHIWRQIGRDPDGTPVFAQQRIFTDVKTGRQTPGPFAPVYYPHPPVRPSQPAPQPVPRPVPQPVPQPAPVQPNPINQTDSLLRQLATLHEQGILSDEEYAAKCKQVLSHL